MKNIKELTQDELLIEAINGTISKLDYVINSQLEDFKSFLEENNLYNIFFKDYSMQPISVEKYNSLFEEIMNNIQLRAKFIKFLEDEEIVEDYLALAQLDFEKSMNVF